MKRYSLLICLLLSVSAVKAMADDVQPSVLVRTMPLQERQLSSRVTGYGTLKPEPDSIRNMNFPIGGRVDSVQVNAGQRVKKGQLLMTVTSDPSSALNYTRAKNALAYARAELRRQRNLFKQQLTTRSQLDSAKKDLKDAEEAMAIQKRLGAGITSNKLLAPISGVVLSVAAVPGDRFTAGENLLKLANVDTLRARLGIEPDDSQNLQPGLKVTISSVLNTNQRGDGKVVWVSGQINPKTQLVDVSVRLEAQGFAPGMRVRGDITVASRKMDAVPRRAVLQDKKGSYIFQLQGHIARRIKVTPDLEDRGWIGIKGEFLQDAPVVTLGNYELKDGAAVRVQAP